MSGSQFIELFVGGLAIGCIYSLIALGFTMIIRATGVLHFAQGEVVMLGAMFGVTAHRLLPLPFIALLRSEWYSAALRLWRSSSASTGRSAFAAFP